MFTYATLKAEAGRLRVKMPMSGVLRKRKKRAVVDCDNRRSRTMGQFLFHSALEGHI